MAPLHVHIFILDVLESLLVLIQVSFNFIIICVSNCYRETIVLPKTKLLRFFYYYYFTGLPVPAVPAGLPSRPRKVPAQKQRTLSGNHDGESSSESSDDGSDEDWVPGSEEVRRRKKMIKRFIPGSSWTLEGSVIFVLWGK